MRLLLFCTFIAFFPHTPVAQTVSPDSLTVRNAHVMAYHQERATVMLFGGADEQKVRGGLWEWNGIRWQQVTAQGPPPRTFPAMAYDRARRRLVLFGGNRVLFGTENDKDTFLNDHWEWDGVSWQQMQIATPPARAEASLAYDLARKRIVLFGGYHIANGVKIRFGDTWEWEGKQWSQVSANGPSPRNGAAMTYDSVQRQVVLFGGSGATGDTWVWNGKAWREVKSIVAEGRFNSAMAFDEKLKQTLRFGGWNGEERVADTWRYVSEAWMRLEVVGPEARNHAAMAYDSKRQRLVLFGGHDGERIFGDTWEWDGKQWICVRAHLPRVRSDNGH